MGTKRKGGISKGKKKKKDLAKRQQEERHLHRKKLPNLLQVWLIGLGSRLEELSKKSRGRKGGVVDAGGLTVPSEKTKGDVLEKNQAMTWGESLSLNGPGPQRKGT